MADDLSTGGSGRTASAASRATRTQRHAALLRARVGTHALVLATALAAVLFVGAVAGRPWLGLAGAILVGASALVTPRAAPTKAVPPVRAGGQAAQAEPLLPSVDELAAAIEDPFILCDRNGIVAFSNDAAGTAFGRFAPGELIALRFRSPEMQELIGTAMAGRQAAPIVHSERVPLERSFKVSATPIGATGRFVLFFRDQSETRRIDRMRADFIANASHELRTPLASISGFVETLRGPARNDPDARARFLAIMQTQTSRMARLIDDLLSLSRLEMKPLAGDGATTDLADIVRQVSVSLGQMLRDTEMELALDLPDAPVRVFANPDEMVQLLENLVENACKYGQSGKRVEIALARDGEDAALTVRDFGPGIASEHIPRLTERFYRVDVETSRAQKGTGLGLSIVKHILSRHKGRLTIRSREGDGATFVIHLPFAGDAP